MLRRPVPATLISPAALFGVAMFAAVIGGITIYAETRAKTWTYAEAITDREVDSGRAAIMQRGCGGCHDIPGTTGASGRVGPPLSKIAIRAHIAGTWPNDPGTMARWLMHPQRMRPGTGMPEQGPSEAEARAIAAYLYTLD